MTAQQTRLDVREVTSGVSLDAGLTVRYRWVVQSTLPVRDLFGSERTFETRAEAVADFEDTAEHIGWRT